MLASLPLVLPLSAPPVLTIRDPVALSPGGGVRPPTGHVWLHGKQADGSHVTLRGLVAVGTYVSLSAKA